MHDHDHGDHDHGDQDHGDHRHGDHDHGDHDHGDHDHGDHRHGDAHDRDRAHGQGGGAARGAGRVAAALRSLLAAGHHHHHHPGHPVDPALSASRRGVRAVVVSLVALLLTALVQLAVVVVTGSVALLSDTLHNFADAGTAVPLWIAFTLGRRRPTRRFPYGLGRGEDLAGLVVVVAIAASAVLAAWQGIERLVDPVAPRHLWAVALAGLVGLVGNELVARYRIRVGREIGSAALVADGLHARTDALTSLAVLAGVAGVAAGFPLADPLAGLAIAAVIVWVLVEAGRDVLLRLLDGVDPELVGHVGAVAAAVPGVLGVGRVRVRWLGHRLHAEVEITVDADATVLEGHTVAEEARHALLHEVPYLSSALVHADPAPIGDDDHHGRLAHHPDPLGVSDE